MSDTYTSPKLTDFINVDMDTGTVHRSFLDHVLCQDNAKANTFGVRLYHAGQPAIIPSATCAGYFIRPDGETVLIEGETNEDVPQGQGMECWVNLPQACYAYTGQFTLIINIHKGNTTTTVRVVDGTIIKTKIGEPIDPGIPIPDIDELLGIIAAAEGHTYAAGAGLDLNGYTFKLQSDVRRQLNLVRSVHLAHSGETGDSTELEINSTTAGWIAIIWHAGTGGASGIKFAHATGEDSCDAVQIVQNSNDYCTISFANHKWTITNTHTGADLRGIAILSNSVEF